jgi:hypothetical protein
VLKLASAELGEVCTADKREDNIRGEPFFDRSLEADSMCRVDEDASMLWGNDCVNDGGEVVYIG